MKKYYLSGDNVIMRKESYGVYLEEVGGNECKDFTAMVEKFVKQVMGENKQIVNFSLKLEVVESNLKARDADGVKVNIEEVEI